MSPFILRLRPVHCGATLLALLAGSALVAAPLAAPAAASTPVVTMNSVFMSPTGSGSACTQAAPCSTLNSALAASAPNAVVYAAAGDYGDQIISPLSRTATSKHVTVESQSLSGAHALFGATNIQQPGTTFFDVDFDGAVRMTAASTVLDQVHVYGPAATVLVHGNYSVVQNSLIEGGDITDGIQIAGYPTAVHDVLIQGNTVRNFTAGTFQQQHPDCIQIFDANTITIQRNKLSNCHNSAITVSLGHKLGVSKVNVLSNFLQGCVPTLQTCGTGSNLDLRNTVSQFVVANNTFGLGAARMPYQAGVYAPRNIVPYLSATAPCSTSLSDSLIGSVPAWLCKTVPGTSVGNVLGSARYVDQQSGNLHLVGNAPQLVSSPSPAQTPAVAPSAVASTDIDGRPLSTNTVGAQETSAFASAVVAGTVSFTTSATNAVVGSSYTPAAQASDGAPVTITASPASVCAISNGTVSFLAVGSCQVTATGAGSNVGTQTVNVFPGVPAVSVTMASSSAPFASPTTATATLTGALQPQGSFQFLVDGVAVGQPVSAQNGVAMSAPLVAKAGVRAVSAHFMPSDTANYASAQSSPVTLTVTTSSTATKLSSTVDGLVATVSAVTTGAPVPNGTVKFSSGKLALGSSQVVNGVATLGAGFAGTTKVTVTAAYAGSANFAPSSTVAVITPPAIRSSVTSAAARSTAGWYRAPVTVHFSCVSGQIPLAQACPAGVTVGRNGASQQVSRSVVNRLGLSATADVRGINIDLAGPRAHVVAVRSGGRHSHLVQLRCAASDALSGVASCTVKVTPAGHGVVHYRVVATDRAGNTTVHTGNYRVAKQYQLVS